MSRVPMYAFSLVALALPAFSQAVISTRSGVVHYFEGTVTVAGKPLTAQFGKFAFIPEGAELRTEKGRAEVLLTPGVFLRVGEKSAIRLTASALADTRVELLAGSVMVESAESAAGTSATLTYKDWSIRQPHEGMYRVDSDPPRVQVRGGEVEVKAVGDASVQVAKGMDLAFEEILSPEKSPLEPSDSLADWSDGRAQSISADNAIAADIQDPASVSGSYMPVDAFTYFPMIGLPSLGSSLSTYGGLSPYAGLYGTSSLYQPGFNAIYLPGYTYRPLHLGLPVGGLGRPLYPPSRFGLPAGSTVPRFPVTRPIAPPPGPRPAVVHVGGH